MSVESHITKSLHQEEKSSERNIIGPTIIFGGLIMNFVCRFASGRYLHNPVRIKSAVCRILAVLSGEVMGACGEATKRWWGCCQLEKGFRSSIQFRFYRSNKFDCLDSCICWHWKTEQGTHHSRTAHPKLTSFPHDIFQRYSHALLIALNWFLQVVPWLYSW